MSVILECMVFFFGIEDGLVMGGLLDLRFPRSKILKVLPYNEIFFYVKQRYFFAFFSEIINRKIGSFKF